MSISLKCIPCGFLALAAVAVSAPAAAQQPLTEERCPRLVAQETPRAIPASLRLAALNPGEVSITYIGHSTFLIESARGVRIATDYNDYVRPRVIPDIATMNRAHSTHYTNHPEPEIRHVLRGWGREGEPARYDLQVDDVWVRNVVTNIRDWGGGTALHGNSIFVFETAGVCIAHLGHLHHTLTPQHIEELGRIDVVMVPVDGTMTLNVEGMVEVLKQIQAPLAIPMHIFSPGTLERFLEAMGSIYEVERSAAPTVVLSRDTLPAKPKMLVLPGR
ncbi:MAG: MBL fold metallo-hydrolase [Bradyrhizobiaceae bacterium]|nr:MBL fold metallo-hydrolase [Bradyrhizobiaceae bacterium]